MLHASVVTNMAPGGADAATPDRFDPQERTRLECMFREHHEFIWHLSHT